MKKGQRLWTRNELLLAINLYCKLPFGKMHKSNPEIIELSGFIERTPSSLALKLANFASLDPSLKARGIKGASNSSKLDRLIWEEFYSNWKQLTFESEKLFLELSDKNLETLNVSGIDHQIREGLEKKVFVKKRINQSFFRKMILASYNNTCCITGISKPELLIAGHIKPWRLDKKNRLNPRNGIAMNPLHDKAFENGLITVTPNYRIKVSPILLKDKKSNSIEQYFLQYENKEIILPTKFLPDTEFLKYHNKERFLN